MNQRNYRQADAWMRTMGLYKRDGRTKEGIFRGSTWSEGKPPKNKAPVRRQKVKPLLPPCQPRETRPTASSRPLMGRIDNRSERVIKIVAQMGKLERDIIDCLYTRGMPMDAIARRLKIEVGDIGASRDKVLEIVWIGITNPVKCDIIQPTSASG